MRKNLLKKSRLYVILDRQACKKRSLIKLARASEDNGADIIQYRDKSLNKYDVYRNACYLRRLLKKSRVLFIVNDYLDIAKITDSDGLHLGQADTPLALARSILGRDKIIGKSCHSLKQALAAEKEGADYIGIGPIFATPTKPKAKGIGPEIIPKIAKSIAIPFFVIGGIEQRNIKKITSYGAGRIAVIRAVCKAGDTACAIKKLNDAIRIREE